MAAVCQLLMVNWEMSLCATNNRPCTHCTVHCRQDTATYWLGKVHCLPLCTRHSVMCTVHCALTLCTGSLANDVQCASGHPGWDAEWGLIWYRSFATYNATTVHCIRRVIIWVPLFAHAIESTFKYSFYVMYFVARWIAKLGVSVLGIMYNRYMGPSILGNTDTS